MITLTLLTAGLFSLVYIYLTVFLVLMLVSPFIFYFENPKRKLSVIATLSIKAAAFWPFIVIKSFNGK